jgi:hypothetical protein
MVIYPFNSPVILTNQLYTETGGQTGSFTNTQLQSSYWLAEMQVSAYIGTLLQPTNVSGTYPFMHSSRLKLDYGYVEQIYDVTILTRENVTNCDLKSNDGCGYIYQDVYGYLDFKRLSSVCSACGWNWWMGSPYPMYAVSTMPYQINVSYQAGLPTGMALQPGIVEALTILAQIDLNEKVPGLVGENESAGDAPLTRFRSIEYAEGRKISMFIRTNMGQSAKVMRAKMLLDMSLKKARAVLLA